MAYQQLTSEIQNDQFKDEIYRGPKGAAKIIKGHPAFGQFKWRIYLYEPNADKACDWADINTRKRARELAAEYVVKGYCG